VAKNSLKECGDQLLRLPRSQVPTSKLAAHAGRIALGFWAELRATQRSELRHWLEFNTLMRSSLSPRAA
jgi:hypothetical protein